MDKLQQLIDRIEGHEFSDVDEVLEAAIALSGKWEAKEKPAPDLWGQHKQMVKMAQDNGLHLAANWAVNMSGKTFSGEPSSKSADGLKAYKAHLLEYRIDIGHKPKCDKCLDGQLDLVNEMIGKCEEGK